MLPAPPSRLVALVAFLVATAGSFGFWAYLGKPVALPDVPDGKLACVSYTPYDGAVSPLDKSGYIVSTERIAADLAKIATFADCVRTYSAYRALSEVPGIAASLGLRVLQGVWISGIPADDNREIETGLRLASAYPDTIRALVVGNEVLLRRELTPAELAVVIDRVRAESPVPVTYADVYDFWTTSTELADKVDFVTVHVLPYWDDPSFAAPDAEQAQAWSQDMITDLRRIFEGKRLLIGEIGWPSYGRPRGGAMPSLVNQARFVRSFAAETAPALGVDYNIIEALDQPWKRTKEGSVGGYWGILDSAREMKFALTGPVSEWSNWPLTFAFSTVLAAIVIGWTVRRRWELSPWRWLLLAAFGQAVGVVLVMQHHYIAASATSWVGWISGGVAAIVSILGAVFLVMLIAGRAVRFSGVQPATVVEAARWLRRPFGVRLSRSVLLGLYHTAVALAVAYFCLTIAFDPRHRDYPVALFVLPAAAVFAGWRATGAHRVSSTDRREEAWVATILLVAGLFCLDGWRNTEAIAWFAIALALALPWVGAIRWEALRLRCLLAEPARAQKTEQETAGS